MTNKIKTHLASNGYTLYWNDDIGYGYLASTAGNDTYDENYWNQYMKLRETEMGKALTKARIELTKKYVDNPDTVLDIGIGNGQFVDEYGCKGYDVNPEAIIWLNENGKYGYPSEDYGYDWYTMWDVLEHIETSDLYKMFESNHKGVILSTPIYKSFDHCINSKHFKPNEHIWYFTVRGVVTFMEEYGYKCVEISTIETQLGRESIGSFVFIKR